MKRIPSVAWIAAAGIAALAVLFFSIAEQQTDAGPGDAQNWLWRKGASLFGKSNSNDLDSIEKETARLKASLKTARLQNAELDALKNEIEAVKATFWNTDRDGEPESKLHDLIRDAAGRAEAISTLGDCKVTPVNKELSCVDVDLLVIDDYGKIIRFFAEVEKCTPRLSWRRFELRLAPARVAPGKPGMIYMTGQIRVFKYVPKAKPGNLNAADSPSTANTKADGGRDKLYSEKLREHDELKAELDRINRDLKSGEKLISEMEQYQRLLDSDPFFLFKLFALSRELPPDVLATSLRFNEGICDLALQTQNPRFDPARHLRFPFWTIVRIQRRIVSDTAFSFTITFRADAQSKFTGDSDRLSDDQIETAGKLNIFAPERVPDSTVNPNGTAAAG